MKQRIKVIKGGEKKKSDGGGRVKEKEIKGGEGG